MRCPHAPAPCPQRTVSLGAITLSWADQVAVALGRWNQLVVMVRRSRWGAQTLRPGSAVPLVDGELRFFANGIVTITKPGLAVQVSQPPIVGSPYPRRAPYLTL